MVTKGSFLEVMSLAYYSQVRADTVDDAQQDNNCPNNANSKDVDQQATRINIDQEHYGDVKENVLSDQEVSESLPTVITNQKDQRTNIHDEEQHGKREENIDTNFSVSKSVCAEDRNQERGQLIDQLKEHMITAQREEQELQDQSSLEDSIVARHGEKQKL
uniref:Uncharacterized protein n=1 Tax=Solanum tuberosum TaxID=4113 RepID=M1DTX7_SOLTU